MTFLSSCGPSAPENSSGASLPVSPGASSGAASGEKKAEARGPLTLGKMKLQELFYAPAESGTVFVADISKESAPMILALRALQGLAAREEKASIFLAEGENDAYWQLYLESEYAVVFNQIRPAELFGRYRGLVDKLYVYDEGKPEFLDAVLTMSACENGLPVTPDMLASFAAFGYADIPQVDARSKWANAKQAYDDVLGKYTASCNPNYIYTGGPADFVDYAYAVKAFFLSGAVSSADHSAVFSKLLARQESGKPALILGSQENAGILTSTGSPYGYAFLPCAKSANTTFFASLPAASKPYSQPIAVDRKAAAGKKYLSLVVTDSSGLGASQEALRLFWEEANNGTLPFAVQLPPVLAELSPAVLNWYYQNRSSHSEIIADTGGFAAIDVKKFPGALIGEWFRLEDAFLKKSGMRMEAAGSLHGLRAGGSGAASAFALRAQNETDPGLTVLTDAADYLVSHGPLDKNAFDALFVSLAGGAADGVEFHSVFLELSGFEAGKLWEFIQLQVKALQLEAPGTVEFLLPGDLLATAKAYAAAPAASNGSSAAPPAASSKKGG